MGRPARRALRPRRHRDLARRRADRAAELPGARRRRPALRDERARRPRRRCACRRSARRRRVRRGDTACGAADRAIRAEARRRDLIARRGGGARGNRRAAARFASLPARRAPHTFVTRAAPRHNGEQYGAEHVAENRTSSARRASASRLPFSAKTRLLDRSTGARRRARMPAAPRRTPHATPRSHPFRGLSGRASNPLYISGYLIVNWRRVATGGTVIGERR